MANKKGNKRRLRGTKLDEYRRSCGLTQRQLSELSGVPHATVERYLKDSAGYRAEILQELIEATNIARRKLALPDIHQWDVIGRNDTTLSDCLFDCLSWPKFLNARVLSLRVDFDRHDLRVGKSVPGAGADTRG